MADSPVGAAEAGSPAEAGSRLGSRAVAAGTPPAAEAGRVERGTRAVARGEGSQTWQQSRYVYTDVSVQIKIWRAIASGWAGWLKLFDRAVFMVT